MVCIYYQQYELFLFPGVYLYLSKARHSRTCSLTVRPGNTGKYSAQWVRTIFTGKSVFILANIKQAKTPSKQV